MQKNVSNRTALTGVDVAEHLQQRLNLPRQILERVLWDQSTRIAPIRLFLVLGHEGVPTSDQGAEHKPKRVPPLRVQDLRTPMNKCGGSEALGVRSNSEIGDYYLSLFISTKLMSNIGIESMPRSQYVNVLTTSKQL